MAISLVSASSKLNRRNGTIFPESPPIGVEHPPMREMYRWKTLVQYCRGLASWLSPAVGNVCAKTLRIGVADQMILGRRILTAVLERLGGRGAGEELVAQDVQCIGDVELPIVVGVCGIIACRRRPAAKELLDQPNRIGDIDSPISVGIPT